MIGRLAQALQELGIIGFAPQAIEANPIASQSAAIADPVELIRLIFFLFT